MDPSTRVLYLSDWMAPYLLPAQDVTRAILLLLREGKELLQTVNPPRGPLLDKCRTLDPDTDWEVVLGLLCGNLAEQPFLNGRTALAITDGALTLRSVDPSTHNAAHHHGSRQQNLEAIHRAPLTWSAPNDDALAALAKRTYVAPSDWGRSGGPEEATNGWLRLYFPDAFATFQDFVVYASRTGHGAHPRSDDAWRDHLDSLVPASQAPPSLAKYLKNIITELVGGRRVLYLLIGYEEGPDPDLPPIKSVYAYALTPIGPVSVTPYPSLSVPLPSPGPSAAFTESVARWTDETPPPTPSHQATVVAARGPELLAHALLYPADSFDSLDAFDAFCDVHRNSVAYLCGVRDTPSPTRTPANPTTTAFSPTATRRTLADIEPRTGVEWMRPLRWDEVKTATLPLALGEADLRVHTDAGYLWVVIEPDRGVNALPVPSDMAPLVHTPVQFLSDWTYPYAAPAELISEALDELGSTRGPILNTDTMQGPLIDLCRRLDPTVDWPIVLNLMTERVKKQPLRFDIFEMQCLHNELVYNMIRPPAPTLMPHTVVTRGTRPPDLHPHLAAGAPELPSFESLQTWSDTRGFIAPVVQNVIRMHSTDVPSEVWLRFYRPEAFPDFTHFQAYTRIVGPGANAWGDLWPSLWQARERWRLHERHVAEFLDDAVREVAGNGRWLLWRHETWPPPGLQDVDPQSMAVCATTTAGFASACVVPIVSQAPSRPADSAFIALASRFETKERSLPPLTACGVEGDARGEYRHAMGALFPLDAFESMTEFEAFAVGYPTYLLMVGFETEIERAADYFVEPKERICTPIPVDVAKQAMVSLEHHRRMSWLAGLTVEEAIADRLPTATSCMRVLAKTSAGWVDLAVQETGTSAEEIGHSTGYHYKDPIRGHHRALARRGPIRAETQRASWHDAWRVRIDLFEFARFWQLDELAIWGDVYALNAPLPDVEPINSLSALRPLTSIPTHYSEIQQWVQRLCGQPGTGYWGETRDDVGTPDERVVLRWYFQTDSGWARATATVFQRQLTPTPTDDKPAQGDDKPAEAAQLGPTEEDFAQVTSMGFIPPFTNQTIDRPAWKATVRMFRHRRFDGVGRVFAYCERDNKGSSQNMSFAALTDAGWQRVQADIEQLTGGLTQGFVAKTDDSAELRICGRSKAGFAFIVVRFSDADAPVKTQASQQPDVPDSTESRTEPMAEPRPSNEPPRPTAPELEHPSADSNGAHSESAVGVGVIIAIILIGVLFVGLLVLLTQMS